MHISHGKRPTGNSQYVGITSTYLGLRLRRPSLQRTYRNTNAFGLLANAPSEVAGLRALYAKSGTDYEPVVEGHGINAGARRSAQCT